MPRTKKRILFTDEFINMFTNNEIVNTILETNSLKLLNLNNITLSKDRHEVDDIIQICQISKEYTENILVKIFYSEDPKQLLKRDVIVLLKNKTIVGFLAVLKGECAVYNTTLALQLVCAKSDDKLKSVPIGTILLSAYLIASKLHNHEFAILEVAGGYKNIKAFCLYDRYGFIEDISIKKYDCFDQEDTIPMIADLKQISIEQIFNTLNRSNGGIISHDSLCSIKDKSLLDAEIKKRDGLFKQISEKNIKLNEEKTKLNKENKKKLEKLLEKKDELETLFRSKERQLAYAIERIETPINPTVVARAPDDEDEDDYEEKKKEYLKEYFEGRKKVYIKELKKIQTKLDIVNKDLKIQKKIIIITK